MHSKIPVTATHISICSKEPLRPTKGIYAELLKLQLSTTERTKERLKEYEIETSE